MVWRQYVIFFARGHSGVRTDGKATVPEGKNNHVLSSNHEVLFLLHVFMILKSTL